MHPKLCNACTKSRYTQAPLGVAKDHLGAVMGFAEVDAYQLEWYPCSPKRLEQCFELRLKGFSKGQVTSVNLLMCL